MSSLSDLPEVIGFFSYSREDDKSYKGRLSALREGIQDELSAQLGRSKTTFRLWQDREAIAPGRLWESEIKTAVEQSVFFIPIVTPRAVNSNYCKFEFEAFLARERALGRADLVFPILYVPVPALQNEAQWRDHPVLSAIAKRQYVDWQTFRYSDVNTPAMREAVGRFCLKIVEALHHSWQSPEERQRSEEAAAKQRTEDQRRQQEAETKRHAEEDARRTKDEADAQRIAEERKQQDTEAKRRADEAGRHKRAEAEARQRAQEERLGRDVEAKQRADQEQAFAAAKLADAVIPVDKFLAAYPESYVAGEATALRATLIARDEAYGGAMSSADPTVLKAFLDHYPAGAPADQVRIQLRRLEPRQSSPLSRRAMVIGGAVVGVGALATMTAIVSHRSGSSDATAPLTSSAVQMGMLTGHTGTVRSVAFAPDGRSALSGSDDKTLRFWDLVADDSPVRTFTGHASYVYSVAFAPDGRTALSGSADKTLRLWDLANGSTIRTFRGHTDRVTWVAISPDGRTALSGSSDKTLRLWDLASGRTVRTFMGHTDVILSVAFAPDGRTALSGSADKTLRLWDLANGSTARTFTGHNSSVESVAFAPDGRTALSGSFDRTLRLWDLANGSTARTFTGHNSSVDSVAFAPDGRSALSGSDDKTLRLWDLANGSTIDTFTGHTDDVDSVAFAPDGRTALSGSADKTLILWGPFKT